MSEQLRETMPRRRREQTPEDLQLINAGVEFLKSQGIDEKAAYIVETLAPVWNSNDKEAIAAAKAQVIEMFGDSAEFKSFVNGDFATIMMPFTGLVKLVPIVNNIRSFYAQRKTTSTKKVTVQIDGVLYSVNAEYKNSIADKSREEKRELILAHKDTVEVQNKPEEL